ncbi:amino acid adenylation domain-containing protein [Kordia periserrulae]|uniref:Amino acid adenylation domain-containing protein n=1 Tax=Kordia periserrulae TaxID=701523 RepID=A0A2T6BZ73_9FLAO|nr:non-ribosomal peptide synthetase [Kordia periserrulae]PTX61372.1 amino acid adenylation domain-containing protein [Kordia periserrulae]
MKELIAEIKSKEIHIAVVDGELEVSFEGELDAELIQKIRLHKQDLINLLQKHNIEDVQNELKAVEMQESYPLSNAQKRLWTVCQIDDNSRAYNIPNTEFLQNVDIEIFNKSVASVIERHESLRTVFKEDESGEIRQWILPSTALNFKVLFVDCSTEETPRSVAEQHIAADKYNMFDLEHGPLVRAHLYRLSTENYMFYFNMHHIISDDISIKVLMSDTMVFYTAYLQHTTPELPPLQIQYKDYAVWQLNQQTSATYKAHQSYWLERFSGELPLLDLGSSNIRPKVLTNNGKHLHMYIDAKVMQKASNYVNQNGGTLFMFLLSVWNVLLARYSSQNEVVIGASVSGRNHADLESQIGFYIETLPLRTKIDWEANFDGLYQQVKEDTLSDFSHNSYPFDNLVNDLQLVRDLSRNPLFDVMFTLDDDSAKATTIDPEKINTVHEVTKGSSLSKFDLDIEMREVQGGFLSFNLIFNTDIYEENFIRQLITHYYMLLEALVSNPSLKLGEIAYLTEEENKQLADFNNEKTAFPEIELVSSLFEKQARKNVDAIALEVSGETLTYRELDEKSNQFANYLISQGVSKGDYVPLYVERSLEMIVGILGIFKSGGVYIPLDVNLPKERVQYIVDDAKAGYFVTKTSLINAVKLAEETQVLHIDFEQLSLESSGYPNKDISPNSEAYIIYTSGTTGKPKGVVLTHQSLGAFLMNVEGQFKNISSQPVLASNGFDIFLFELFNPLLSGGKVILLKDEEVRDLDYLLTTLENVAAFHAVPVLMAQIVKYIKEHEIQHKYTKVKELYIGGDEVPTHVLEDMYEVFPNATIHVFYGPTEGTVFVTTKNYERKETTFKGAVIGTPNISSQIYILDEYNKKVPFGVTGELCIGGAQVGKGYLHNEALTAEKFIQNPFKATEKIYKTGDLAQWLPNGNITFIGRKDNQVKIRGHRIELEEIVKRLQSKVGIEKAIVVVKGKQEQKELVAYVVSKETQNVTELRNYLGETLPNYMIPSFFVNLDEIPQTANGKLDKNALPDPADLGMESGIEYEAPSNEIETMLVALWEKILNLENIGVSDNFFHLGGDSIKGIRIISDIKKEYNVKVSLGLFFQQPTIKSLAEDIANSLWQNEEESKDEAVDILEI